MICTSCAQAADRIPGAVHCDETGGPSWACTCQHRDRPHTDNEPKEQP